MNKTGAGKYWALVLAASLIPCAAPAQPAGYTVVGRGADWRVLQKVTVEHGTNRVHQYTELAAGMNYTNASGQWVESQEAIEPFPGGAVARHGAYQVIFARNLNTAGAVDQQTPDNP